MVFAIGAAPRTTFGPARAAAPASPPGPVTRFRPILRIFGQAGLKPRPASLLKWAPHVLRVLQAGASAPATRRQTGGVTMDAGFVQAKREMTGISAGLERRLLVWMARRMPRAVGADHLTALGFLSMVATGACFWLAGTSRLALAGVIVFLVLNWFGDSLDGTVARVRCQQRPRYGFYVDHVLDMFGTASLLCGMALSGFMTPLVAVALLAAYMMLMTEVYLATYCIASFRMGFFRVGPTELRVVLAVGAAVLAVKPRVELLGHRFLLFDVGATIAIAGILLALVSAAVQHTIELYRAEPLPAAQENRR
jgi:phosphatidylglycerophosphate synthase